MTLRLLLVEDDETTLKELGDVLEKERFDVRRAADGRSGWEAFRSDHADIVITDLKMPGMSGLELMRQVKELRPEVPVILTTAYGETDVAIEALRLGALDYFKKPVELEELLVAVGRAREVALRNRDLEDYPTVLLAEDDATTRKNLAEVLEKEDWRVVLARDGRDAVEQFRSRPADIVLADVKMPRLDGIRALAEMRSLRTDFEAIILTGYGDEATAIEALRNGAMSFIRKPVDLDELLVTLQKAKEKLTLERSLRYRTREVDLARQIIAQISEHGEIILRLSDSNFERTKQQIAQALGHLSDSIAIVDDELRVVFANRTLERLLGVTPAQIDEPTLAALADRSRGRLIAGQIEECIDRTRRGRIGGIETIGDAGGVTLLCVKARARAVSVSRDYVLLLLRGAG